MFQFSWGLVDRPPARPYVNWQGCHGHLCQLCYGWQFHSFGSADQSGPMQGLWRNLQKEDSGICFPLTRHLRIRIAIENTPLLHVFSRSGRTWRCIGANRDIFICSPHFHIQCLGCQRALKREGKCF